MTALGPKLSYGEMRDKLSPDDVDGKTAVLTISGVDVKNLAPAGTQREDNKLVLTFEQFPDKEYIANATSYKTLCLKLGEDYSKWIGEPCVMSPTTTTYQGKAFEKLHVASPERWDKATAQARSSSTKRR